MDKSRGIYLVLISASHGINHFYQLLMPVIIPKILVEYNLDLLSAGLLISVYNISYALLQTLSSLLSKKIGRRDTIILGLLITSVSFLVFGFVDNLLMLAVILFVAGIGGSTYHPNGMPLISEYYSDSRGKAAGFHQTGGSLGSVLAPLIIGTLVVILGWRLTTIILTIPGFALALIMRFTIPKTKQKTVETEKQHDSEKTQRESLNMYWPSLLFIVATVIYTLGIRGVNSLAVLYFQNGRGIEYTQANYLFSALQVAGLFSGPLCGRLSDFLGRKKVISILVIIEAVCLYTLTAISNILLFIPCIIFGFSSFGLLAVTDAFLADITPKSNIETIFGLHFTLSFFTQVIIPPIYGLITSYTGSLDSGFIALSAVIPFSIPVLLLVKTKKNYE